ncbi:helix-turn-helix transcriptional regulator [Aquimarina sp. 2201CG14-23]|uniref:helix-turn-helix transcriptional regulator n=1 Tax=Aquimarina mycalae TaxID=3040073 RepID=UPI002477FBE2|nr:hypothetical protein [Aquimarina sp. 2201CG14-23]MDH7447193.1 hypothetical protein [Aquimarina sp. 2201CG14-23]
MYINKTLISTITIQRLRVFFLFVSIATNTIDVLASEKLLFLESHTILRDSLQQPNSSKKEPLFKKQIERIKDSIVKIKNSIIDDHSNATADKYRMISRLSKKAGLSDQEVDINGALMFHYYELKERDSVFKYIRVIKNKLQDIENKEESVSEKRIRWYLNLSYVMSSYYGYTPTVIEFYEKGYELSLQKKYCRGMIWTQLRKTDLILENNPTKEELNKELEDIELLMQEHWEDNIHHHTMYRIMSRIFLAQNDYKKAEEWGLKSLDPFNSYRNGLGIISLSKVYFQKGYEDRALQLIKEAIICLQDSIAYKDTLGEAYYYNFIYLKSKKENINAIISIKKAIDSSLSLVKQIRYIDELIIFLRELNQLKKAQKYEVEKQELFATFAKVDILNNGEFFVLKKNEKDMRISNASLVYQIKNKNLKQNALIFLILILLIVGFCFYKKGKQERLISSDIISTKSEEWKKEIQRREDELQLVTIKIADRITRLKELKYKVANINTSDPNIIYLNQQLNELIKSGEHIEEVRDRLVKQYPGIVRMLRKLHPTLTDTEIKYCLLTKLNLSIKDTAEILHVAPTTVKHAKSMIKKKIGFSKELSLKNYLQQLFEEKEMV